MERSDGSLHDEATTWLGFLVAAGKSPNTIRAYGLRLAAYLSWSAASGRNWRKAGLPGLVEWKTMVLGQAGGSEPRPRKTGTVNAWMTAVVEFYKWAEASGVIEHPISGLVYEPRYIAAGLYGGEQGRIRQVRVPELQVKRVEDPEPLEWIESPTDRAALLDLALAARDRFLVDLLFFSGLRVGEALALFRQDLHFLPDSSALGCQVGGPHVHVRSNQVLNGARAKSGPRWVPVPDRVVFSYEDYLLERHQLVGIDGSPHVLVNLYRGNAGTAMTYAGVRDLFARISQGITTRVRPHMLRHTRATMWLRGIDTARLDLDTVRVLLGHASLEATSIYAHSRAEDLRAAVGNATLEGAAEKSR
ncbi:tyrosine-type recombinase/integrase [Arthrobacter bambusae]|uniref:tyrosine-type recombinase/integrase n=1 Tax=Arthrobacter bambusae TaxID=1338426 RepID=UPI00277FE7EC|nr:tyrosine-type recombinase/integrase [Arthrobacter bambusae]MDQ0241414.1 site-specific recombinase XerD [Arthrobacter bambusae]